MRTPVALSAVALAAALGLARCQHGVGAGSSAGAAGAGPSRAPLTYCGTLQPHLARAAAEAGLAVELRCLSTPGLTEVGFFGRRSNPTERTFDRCFTSPESGLTSESTPVSFDWSYRETAAADRDGRTVLPRAGGWLPRVELAAAGRDRVTIELRFTDVRVRRISDVVPALRRQGTAEAASCIAYLCRTATAADQPTFAAIALVGRLAVRLDAGEGARVALGEPGPGELALEASRSEGHFALSSRDLVTIAVVSQDARPMLADDGMCSGVPVYRDGDGDGAGDPAVRITAVPPVEGYVADPGDCFDHNAEARPGRERWFDVQRGDGRFDYDCDGREEARWSEAAAGCAWSADGAGVRRCEARRGWVDGPPACGATGAWLEDCDVTTGSFPPTCAEERRTEKRQECR